MIETPRLILRPYTPDDLDALFAIQSDPLTMRFWSTPFTKEDTRVWMQRAMSSFAENGFGRMAIILRQTGEQIGDAGIMRVPVNGKDEIDLGYIIRAPYWRQGFGLEAATAVLAFAKELGHPRVVANMAHDNTASERVAQRLGMTKETEFHNARNRNILTFLYAAEFAPDRLRY